MGKSDAILKIWLGEKERFADLYNGSVFQGKQIIKAEDLSPMQKETRTSLTSKDEKLNIVEKYRDLAMKWDNGINLVILACENQEKIHYAMPVRNMLYDGLNYTEQIRQLDSKNNYKNSDEFLSKMKKKDKLCPTITLVFYYGEKNWDGSKDLHGMLKFSNNPEVDEILKKMIPNYYINLLDVNGLEDTSVYKTDLQVIFEMLKYKSDKNKIREYVKKNEMYFRNMDIDTYNVLKVLLNAEKQLADINVDDKGEIDMCKALQGIYEEGREEGRRKLLLELVKEGTISITEAAVKCGISEAKFEEFLKESELKNQA